jgi:hypothetical protein
MGFEKKFYPHRWLRNLSTIGFIVLLHFAVVYLLLNPNPNQSRQPGVQEGQLVFFDWLANQKSKELKPSSVPFEKKALKRRTPSHGVGATPARSMQSNSPAAVLDTLSQVIKAREQRRLLEEEAAKQNQQQLSEDDGVMARIHANIRAANYKHQGTNGIFQILSIGVQTGKFSFRGWTDDPHDSIKKTYRVDAGVGGDVKLALIRRMIQLIREHYSGDFNWESQRLNKVVRLSARPEDNASLEAFLMREFF